MKKLKILVYQFFIFTISDNTIPLIYDDYKWNICKLVSGKDKIADLEYCDLNDIDIYRDFE